jgi:hypothetical protein
MVAAASVPSRLRRPCAIVDVPFSPQIDDPEPGNSFGERRVRPRGDLHERVLTAGVIFETIVASRVKHVRRSIQQEPRSGAMSRAFRGVLATLIALTLGVAAAGPTVAAPPANDDVGSSTGIDTVPFADTLDTSEATPDEADPECSTGADNPTVWYRFTPADDGVYGVSTFGSDYDTTLVIGVDGEAGVETLVCNDDAGGPTSAIVGPVMAGVEYLIMVGACCDQPGGKLEFQLVSDPAEDDPAFQPPPDMSAFFELRPRGEAGPLWRDSTATTTGPTGAWTNKVEVVDIDDDGLLDVLHANGGDYDTPGQPEGPKVFRNAGPAAPFEDVSERIFGDEAYHARVIKARDVTGDGVVDLLVGTTYETQSRLLRGLGDGDFEDVTETSLPQARLSVGDLEVGDVDADGDIDIVLADWGPGSPLMNEGGPVRLWRNDGQVWTEDAEAMPATPIGFSWDLELIDVDADWDLDVAVSCKVCETSRLYLNDGSGRFQDVSATHMPPAPNNYEFEAMDLDGDGAPELVTINDGPALTERVLLNDGAGVFSDVTAEWWPPDQNPGFDDNVIAFLDVESDGDADFIVGSLDGPDRLMLNDGSGRLLADPSVFDGPETPGTLHMAVADLDGDGRRDVVEGEGEVAAEDHVFLGTDELAVDSGAPAIDAVDVWSAPEGGIWVLARIHDRDTPVLPDDFTALTASIGDQEVPLTWYGEALWRAAIAWDSETPGADDVRVCATDRAGNEACVGPS